MSVGQLWFLRARLGGVEAGQLLLAAVKMGAASALAAGAAWGIWDLIDRALGASLPAQLASVGCGLAVGLLLYVALVLALRDREALFVVARFRSAVAARRA